MVLKIGIDQIPRSPWTFLKAEDGLVSANYVSAGAPIDNKLLLARENKFNFGFNDFVIAEITPNIAYQIHGGLEQDVELPPKHVRAQGAKTPRRSRDAMFALAESTNKHKSGYTTMAYGWGNKSEVFDLAGKNEYIDVQGPGASDMSGEPFVKLVALPIPGGLKASDTFWIDLNKGLRALYFPARFVYSDEFRGDAGYAKINFVEEGNSRNLIDASGLMAENTVGKALFGLAVELDDVTRKTTETVRLNSQFHIGAYGFTKTLIVNIPLFIETSYLVSTDQTAAPHDALYLAESSDISAIRRQQTNDWHFPQESFDYQLLGRGYAAELSRVDQINLFESTTTDIGAGTEFALSLLVMAVSLVPYVGPLLATAGSAGIESLKNIQTDSTPAEVSAAGISGQAWGAALGELKDKFVQRIAKDLPKILKMFRR